MYEPSPNAYQIDAEAGTASLTITRRNGDAYTFTLDLDDLGKVQRRQ